MNKFEHERDLTAGLVVAGGRSSRMGQDKALVVLAGQPLLSRASAGLRPACHWVGVSVRGEGPVAELAAQLGLDRVTDPPGAADGPLVGVLEGLKWAAGLGAKVLVTAPCDAPFLPTDLAERLIAASGGRRCAAARTPGGPQPLCAAWPVAMAEVLIGELAGGRHPPVRATLEAGDVAWIEFADEAAFLNINSPEDLARAAARAG